MQFFAVAVFSLVGTPDVKTEFRVKEHITYINLASLQVFSSNKLWRIERCSFLLFCVIDKFLVRQRKRKSSGGGT